MSAQDDYWIECVAQSAKDCGAILTKEQIEAIAADVQCCHENYGMAFYSPPASERLHSIENEWKRKYQELQRELDVIKSAGERAIKYALRLHSDTSVSINDRGEVYANNGRTTRVL